VVVVDFDFDPRADHHRRADRAEEKDGIAGPRAFAASIVVRTFRSAVSGRPEGLHDIGAQNAEAAFALDPKIRAALFAAQEQ
jgi:hypothetical protein